MYCLSIKPFYENEEELPCSSCMTRSMNALKIDKKELELMFGLWKGVCKMRHPLPTVARIVPMWIAVWNAVKSGSDTITKLLDSTGDQIPIPSAQNMVCGRLIKLYVVVAFRCFQMITATKSVSQSASLESYRKLHLNARRSKNSCKRWR